MTGRRAQQTHRTFRESRPDSCPGFPGVGPLLTQVIKKNCFGDIFGRFVAPKDPLSNYRDGDTKQLMSDTNPFRAVITARFHYLTDKDTHTH